MCTLVKIVFSELFYHLWYKWLEGGGSKNALLRVTYFINDPVESNIKDTLKAYFY